MLMPSQFSRFGYDFRKNEGNIEREQIMTNYLLSFAFMFSGSCSVDEALT